MGTPTLVLFMTVVVQHLLAVIMGCMLSNRGIVTVRVMQKGACVRRSLGGEVLAPKRFAAIATSLLLHINKVAKHSHIVRDASLPNLLLGMHPSLTQAFVPSKTALVFLLQQVK